MLCRLVDRLEDGAKHLVEVDVADAAFRVCSAGQRGGRVRAWAGAKRDRGRGREEQGQGQEHGQGQGQRGTEAGAGARTGAGAGTRTGAGSKTYETTWEWLPLSAHLLAVPVVFHAL